MGSSDYEKVSELLLSRYDYSFGPFSRYDFACRYFNLCYLDSNYLLSTHSEGKQFFNLGFILTARRLPNLPLFLANEKQNKGKILNMELVLLMFLMVNINSLCKTC